MIGLNVFLLVHDYYFDDPTSLEYICKDFQVVLLYFRGKSYRPSNFNQILGIEPETSLIAVGRYDTEIQQSIKMLKDLH